ncbi:TetR/AcrR family transcriptional regulator [Lacticaseibacillus nasuensis]|nr:TetR/AcrR family transcriptional regulator [Lacticaseibacillus nasuensis]
MNQLTNQPRDPEKVARILQAALHEFATLGYHAAKTSVIASTAQVSKG